MSTIPISWACWYLTEVEGIEWRDMDYTAWKIVKAVKGEPIKGHFEIIMSAGKQPRRFDQGNVQEFVQELTGAIGRKLRKTYGDGSKISLVPIPNSDAVAPSAVACRTDELAKQIAGGFGDGAVVEPLIRWKAARSPQHKSAGRRYPDQFQEQMILLGKPKHSVVLFDDVMTSGSQLIAGARLLAEAGYQPARAIVVGRVTKTQEEKMVGWGSGELRIGHETIDASDIEF